MRSDLSGFRDLYHRSVAASVHGDPDVQKQLWSRRAHVTLANPLGPPVAGPEEVFAVIDDASGRISDGEAYEFHTVSSVETPALAYEVAIERSLARIAGAAEQVQVEPRVTTVFRRETASGDWSTGTPTR